MLPKKKELPPPPPVPKVPSICPLPIWKHAYSGSSFVRLAGLFGASAVALGAYGAHGEVNQNKEYCIIKNKIFLLEYFYKIYHISFMFKK